MDIKIFDGEHAFLSNFYNAPVNYGLTYGNAEAAYQAQKTLNFDTKIEFTEYNGGKAKRMAKKLDARADWQEIRLAVMSDIVFAKFFQNLNLAAKLLATGDANLIEGNDWHDTFWGVDLLTGEGENHLGKILMAVRGELNHPEIMAADMKKIWLTRFTLPQDTIYRFSGGELNFARKYEFTHKDFNCGIDGLMYHFRGRQFTDLSFRDGDIVKEIDDRFGTVQQIRLHEDGTKFFYRSEDIPVFDSGDAEWDNVEETIIYRDAAGVHIIGSRHGWQIPKIFICAGLQTSTPALAEIVAHLA